MKKGIVPDNLYSRIAGLLQAAKQNVVRAVNQTMVYTYYEIGRMIVEDEQQGKERAEYGKQVLKELSKRLATEFGKGFSERNLEQMRQFYLTYSISQKSSAKLQESENEIITISTTPLPKFNLSWSHYLKLMRIENPAERRFYEIECATGNWSLKELQRQFNSALYERLALSRDKEGVMQMYVNYHDRFVRLPDENKTIGIILCKDKSQTLVEITLPENNDQIFASRYHTVLPDKQEFIQLLDQGYS
jgi:hypothetical protein